MRHSSELHYPVEVVHGTPFASQWRARLDELVSAVEDLREAKTDREQTKARSRVWDARSALWRVREQALTYYRKAQNLERDPRYDEVKRMRKLVEDLDASIEKIGPYIEAEQNLEELVHALLEYTADEIIHRRLAAEAHKDELEAALARAKVVVEQERERVRDERLALEGSVAKLTQEGYLRPS